MCSGGFIDCAEAERGAHSLPSTEIEPFNSITAEFYFQCQLKYKNATDCLLRSVFACRYLTSLKKNLIHSVSKKQLYFWMGDENDDVSLLNIPCMEVKFYEWNLLTAHLIRSQFWNSKILNHCVWCVCHPHDPEDGWMERVMEGWMAGMFRLSTLTSCRLISYDSNALPVQS